MYYNVVDCLMVKHPAFDAAFKPFFRNLKARLEAEHDANFPRLAGGMKMGFEVGRRYVKLIRESGGQKSAYGFVDVRTGDVLKAASWKAPAKHARGNIYADDNGQVCCGQYGVAYLR